MERRKVLLLLSAALISFLLVLGLQRLNLKPDPPNLFVSAAASLKEVMEEIQPLYQTTGSDCTLTFNFGASGALLQQIQQGAPVDVFISAATRQMDTLEQRGELVVGTRRNLATNKLVLIVPKDSNRVTGFEDLSKPEVRRIAIGESRSVPAGQYAEQVLQKLNLLTSIKPKLVYANTVRQVLASVESGNADAGFVYATDARISDRVNVAAIANDADHVSIVYPMAVLKASQHVEAAKAFLQYLSSNEAKTVLRKYEFIVK